MKTLRFIAGVISVWISGASMLYEALSFNSLYGWAGYILFALGIFLILGSKQSSNNVDKQGADC